jgi:hypothetical protein
MAAEILRRLRFSKDETEQILALVDNHMRFGVAAAFVNTCLLKPPSVPKQ